MASMCLIVLGIYWDLFGSILFIPTGFILPAELMPFLFSIQLRWIGNSSMHMPFLSQMNIHNVKVHSPSLLGLLNGHECALQKAGRHDPFLHNINLSHIEDWNIWVGKGRKKKKKYAVFYFMVFHTVEWINNPSIHSSWPVLGYASKCKVN